MNEKALTQEKVDKVRVWASEGYKKRNIAAALEITVATFNKWLRDGDSDLANENDTLNAALKTAYDEGRSQNEIRLLNGIRKAGDKDWKANKFLLETEYKNEDENYNTESKQVIDAKVDSNLDNLSRDDMVQKIFDMIGIVNQEGEIHGNSEED